MSNDGYSPVIRSLHQLSHGAYEEALQELDLVWSRALESREKSWAAMVLWHCMIISEKMGDWPRAAEYGERVLRLQDDAYLRLFLFRAYRRLGDDDKAAEHLRASVDLADDTHDQSFLETLVRSATHDEGAAPHGVRAVEMPRAQLRRSASSSNRLHDRRVPAALLRNVRARDV